MVWRIDFTQSARKQFSKLDTPVKKAAQTLFDRLSGLEDPRLQATP